MPEPRAAGAPRVITISTVTIVKVAVFALALAFLYLIRDIVALFFVSLVLASIINPLASWFEARKMRRGLAVVFLYVVILALIALIVTTLIPPLVAELRDLLLNADTIWAKLLGTFGPLRDFIESHGLADNLSDAMTSSLNGAAVGKGLVATVGGFLTGVVSVLIVFVVAFYLVVSDDALKRLFRAVAPEAYQPYLVDLFSRIEKSIGDWVRAQLVLGLIVGTAVFAVLSILGVRYAIVLALAAGIGESIPYLGPVMAALPAVAIALTQSPLKALLTAAAYLVIQQTESHILVPKIIHRATGLHPVISIFALLIGVKVAGLVGAVLAIPTAMALGIIASDAFRMVKANR